MLTVDRRRVRPVATVALALLILAFIPLAPLRIIARYVLVAYLPGLTIWKRIRPASASLVDSEPSYSLGPTVSGTQESQLLVFVRSRRLR